MADEAFYFPSFHLQFFFPYVDGVSGVYSCDKQHIWIFLCTLASAS